MAALIKSPWNEITQINVKTKLAVRDIWLK